MNLLYFILRESKLTIAVVAFFGLISGFSSTLFIRTIHRVIDPNVNDTTLAYQFIGACFLFLFSTLGSHLPLLRLSEGAVFKLRIRIVRNILGTELRYLEKLGNHKLYASLTDDVAKITQGFTIIPGTLINIVVLLGCFTYLGMLSWKILIAQALFLFLLAFLMAFTTGRANKVFSKARDLTDTLFDYYKTITGGIKELKLHAARRTEFVDKRLIPTSESFRRYRIKGLSAFQIATALGNLGFFLVIGGLIFVMPSWGQIDASMLSGVVLVFVFMMNPLTILMDLFRIISEAGVSLRKVEQLGLDLQKHSRQEEEILQPGGKHQQGAWQRLTLENVVHTYFNERKDEQFTMGPINMHLTPGEVVFLIGGNGSGKSTLAKLVTALYLPEEGQVKMDGKTIDDRNREWYRQYFSTVFADFHLFDEFLGIKDPLIRKNATQYLAGLHLEHKVTIEDEKLSTTQLSTGQRKRLALLIAYLEDRPIYLFDEWASDQDPHFKNIFYTEILPELKSRGKAVLVISHDDRYFPQADRIIKLDNGQIVESKEPDQAEKDKETK